MNFLVAAMILVHCSPLIAASLQVPASYSIELEEFRWTEFPLEVFVDMNQWSTPDYAIVVREALDNWMKSIWNYTYSYNDTSLLMINYLYYVGGVNTTSEYDVLITFTANKMPPSSNTVGLTVYQWEPSNRKPVPPIKINITTFSATADNLFVKNVAMHEFGHALGLGHASPSSTSNGPELMYYASSKNQIVYPSTLDVYGLTSLYGGTFSQSVELPSNIPYVMLAQGDVIPPQTTFFEDYKGYFPIIVVLLLLAAVAIVLGQIDKGKTPEETTQQPPPLPPAGVEKHLRLW